jgi:hypothetical protein
VVWRLRREGRNGRRGVLAEEAGQGEGAEAAAGREKGLTATYARRIHDSTSEETTEHKEDMEKTSYRLFRVFRGFN